jgi:hypothetical protein
MWNLISICLETVVVCTICAKHTIGSKIILDALEVLRGDKTQVEACFRLFEDCDNLHARWVHSLRRTYHGLRNRF